MKERNGGKAVNEQYLFHGTDESLIEAICEQNFDWRMCGVHGTAYGKGTAKHLQHPPPVIWWICSIQCGQFYLYGEKATCFTMAVRTEYHFFFWTVSIVTRSYLLGSYFARDASYSDRYASVKGSLNKIMFVALVLVGEYTRGSSSYVRPPTKGNNRTLYDSCVDNDRDPSIYVVFDKQQIYPEYVINYSWITMLLFPFWRFCSGEKLLWDGLYFDWTQLVKGCGVFTVVDDLIQ